MSLSITDIVSAAKSMGFSTQNLNSGNPCPMSGGSYCHFYKISDTEILSMDMNKFKIKPNILSQSISDMKRPVSPILEEVSQTNTTNLSSAVRETSIAGKPLWADVESDDEEIVFKGIPEDTLKVITKEDEVPKEVEKPKAVYRPGDFKKAKEKRIRETKYEDLTEKEKQVLRSLKMRDELEKLTNSEDRFILIIYSREASEAPKIQRFDIPIVLYSLEKVFVNEVMSQILETKDILFDVMMSTCVDKSKFHASQLNVETMKSSDDHEVLQSKVFTVSMAMVPIMDNRFVEMTVRVPMAESSKDKHLKVFRTLVPPLNSELQKLSNRNIALKHNGFLLFQTKCFNDMTVVGMSEFQYAHMIMIKKMSMKEIIHSIDRIPIRKFRSLKMTFSYDSDYKGDPSLWGVRVAGASDAEGHDGVLALLR